MYISRTDPSTVCISNNKTPHSRVKTSPCRHPFIFEKAWKFPWVLWEWHWQHQCSGTRGNVLHRKRITQGNVHWTFTRVTEPLYCQSQSTRGNVRFQNMTALWPGNIMTVQLCKVRALVSPNACTTFAVSAKEFWILKIMFIDKKSDILLDLFGWR